MDTSHHLSEEEIAKLAVLFDRLMEMASKRYGLSAGELQDVVEYVKCRKERGEKLINAGSTGLISVLAMALLASLWEGIKAWIRRP